MTRTPHAPSRSPRSRRGAVYMIVLATGTLVLTLGLGGIAVSRSLARTIDRRSEASSARLNAESAVEIARRIIASDPAWRTNRSNGDWFKNTAVGDGTMGVNVTNPNGSLNRSPTDPVVITGTGTVGGATQTVQVRMEAVNAKLTCLDVSICAGGQFTTDKTVGPAGNTFTSNTGISISSTTVDANAESAGTILGFGYNGTKTALAKPRTLPDSTAFDYYIAQGTNIAYTSIPTGSGGREIKGTLISPAVNPYSGGTNAQGIYIIDCQNQSIAIDSCRIVGTIVVLNASVCTLQSETLMEPAVANLPCLLVRGNLVLKNTGNLLKESDGSRPNYNPAGTPFPYQGGSSNTNSTDTYTSSILGLVYVSGNLTVSNDPMVKLLVVGGTVSASGTLRLNYDAVYAQNPPPGFGGVTMRPRLGTFSR